MGAAGESAQGDSIGHSALAEIVHRHPAHRAKKITIGLDRQAGDFLLSYLGDSARTGGGSRTQLRFLDLPLRPTGLYNQWFQ